MPVRSSVVFSLLAILACSSQKPAGSSNNGQYDSGAATGGSGDAGHQPDADTDAAATGGALNTSGGQSSGAAGLSNSSTGGASNTGSSSNTGGTANGGTGSSSGGLSAGTGGTSQSPGLPNLCSSNAKPSQPQTIADIALVAQAHFAAITPDELTILWTVPSANGVAVYVADRTSVDASWNTPQGIPSVPAADSAVTITPDGLTIAYVDNSDHPSFATASRVDRSSAFEFPDPNSGYDFAVLNLSAVLGNGDTYTYPLYGPHSTSFYYAVQSANGDRTWYVAGRYEPGDLFTTGSALNFSSAPAATAILSGVSFDENTLFFADVSSGQSSWTFFDEISVKFGPFATLGNLGYVQPNQSCRQVYGGTVPGAIVTATLD